MQINEGLCLRKLRIIVIIAVTVSLPWNVMLWYRRWPLCSKMILQVPWREWVCVAISGASGGIGRRISYDEISGK